MTDQIDTDLESILSRAARPTSDDDAHVRDHVAHMAQTIATPVPAKRRRPGLVAAILVPALALGSAGVAYAATGLDWARLWDGPAHWEGWALSPDTSFTYDLPGGGSCEMRVGDVTYSPEPQRDADVEVDPAVVDVAREFLRTAELSEVVDVDAALTRLRAAPSTYVDESGDVVPFGYGTDEYDADVEYNIAMKDAVHAAVADHVTEAGLPDAGWGFSAQEQCTGTQP